MDEINKEQLRTSISYIKNQVGEDLPDTAVVLGSGLGNFVEHLTDTTVIPMGDIPGYPRPTVIGHGGKIVLGTLSTNDKSSNTKVCTFQGRIHFYECGDITKVLYPVFVMQALGIKKLLITNAAGAINKQFSAGDLMIIRDQINLTFRRPISIQTKHIRESSTSNPLFDPGLSDLIQKVAMENSIKIRNGVYAGVLGPSYETPAEIDMLHRLGADAIGMSTVLETLQAGMFGIKVAGISCITNMAAGISIEKLSHDDVTITASRVNKTFIRLLSSLLTDSVWMQS
jgi:purine-nucleoside phosphorylase